MDYEAPAVERADGQGRCGWCDDKGYCKNHSAVRIAPTNFKSHWICKKHARALMALLHETLDDWQDPDRCWIESERQNECRYDCQPVPG